MWLSNDYLAAKLVKQYQAEHEERARIVRLLKETKDRKAGWGQRLLSGTGELLIQIGHRLKRSVVPKLEINLSLYRTLPE